MTPGKSTIEEFLGGPKTIFAVPVFQRNYNWLSTNCERLFSDICRAIDTGNNHFLGTICYQLDKTQLYAKSVIDGQQRLTTIMLLLKAMHDYTSDVDIRHEIETVYFYNWGTGIEDEYSRHRLHLNEWDDAIYHIILENEKGAIGEKLSIAQCNSLLYQNYLLLSKLVDKYVSQGGTIKDIMKAMRQLTIIVLKIDDDENPQEIFESLNSTGKSLTDVDRLRNYFLLPVTDLGMQKKLYKEYWREIEDAIGENFMEQFFVDFLIFKRRSDSVMIDGRRGHLTENILYEAFKEYYISLPNLTNESRTLRCLEELKESALLYRNFLFRDDVNLAKETPLRRKLYFLLSVNDSNKARCLLLYIFDLRHRGVIDDGMLDIAVDAISSLTFRARICKAQGINRQFTGSVMQRMDASLNEVAPGKRVSSDHFTDIIWQALTSGRGTYAFPSDAEFMDALIHKDMYLVLRSRGTKFLLYLLESNSPYPKGLPAFDDDTISIEHIMPQTLKADWKAYLSRETLEQYETLKHRLGNLALTNYNSELSNKSFAEKKPIYKESNYYYTREIYNYDEWQLRQIDARSRKLAEAALKIWQLPEKYQSRRVSTRALHVLGEEDVNQFAFTKPSLLVVGDSEFSVDAWGSLVPTLCNMFDDENHDAFIEIARPETCSAFRLEDEAHIYAGNYSFVHITENVYVKQFMSSSAVLRSMIKIAKAFDTASGSEYEQNILFALK